MAATASQAAELKQQGALEAAADASSSVTAEQAERKIVEEAKKSGSAGFLFDADATPAQKAAQAASSLPTIVIPERKPKAVQLATDLDDGAPQHDLPTPSTPGAPPLGPQKALNGNIHTPEDEGWERVGWEPRFGFPPGDFDSSESLQDQLTWLETRLGDRFYGDWWHNAGIIIFACLSCWTIAVLGGGLGYVFIIMAFCATYYRTSIRRVRRNYRDDVNRELAKTRLETDTESLEWINSFLVKFWPIYAPVLCKTIIQSVDQVLSTTTPAFLDSMRMKTFVLGTKPPRLEHVKTYPKSEDDIVLMDWNFSFNPNDTSDMTARQIKVKQNPKVVLEIRVGKGVVSKGLDVIVEDFACSGLMRVKIKLQLPFPHIERVELSFLGRPTIDYVCKPIGGELFGLDTNFIPGLSGFIMEQIHANLGPMMYDPNVFPIEIAKMLAGTPVDRAIGALQITFHGAQGLSLPGGGTPDPYAVVTINSRQELFKTKTVKEERNPRWSETTNIIITSLTDTLDILVYDWNDFRKDVQIGRVTFPLEQLEQQDEYENQQLQVIYNGKPRGIIRADLRYFPVLGTTKLEDGTVLPAPESMTGIARFNVEQAKDLDGTMSLIGQLNPYAVLELNGKEVQISQKLKRTNNPIWTDAYKELLISNRKTAKLGLVIKDDRDISSDPILGTYHIKLDDLLELNKKGQEWFHLSGAKTGRAKMTLEWKPIAMKGALMGSDGYITPIGVMRLHFQNARDLKNVETVGKSDPYVRVLLSGVSKGRTVTWKNDLNPDWDEVIYVPVHSPHELITCEVMDEESGINRDRLLGHFSIDLREYVRQNRETGEYEEHDEKKVINQPLSMGPSRPMKGTVSYTCSFFPAIPVVDPEEEEREEEAAKEATVNGDVARRQSTGSKRSSSETPRKSAEYLTPTRTQAKSNIAGAISPSKTPSPNVSIIDLTNKLAESEKDSEESIQGEKEVPKIVLNKENLMDYGMHFKLWDMKFFERRIFGHGSSISMHHQYPYS
jgi:Ca2+-dependent lipid-binding protein